MRMVHELQVHQVELELQNEELRDTRLALESALGRFTELFDFAPIGYFAIDSAGNIRELNFAAARLLGIPRATLLGHPLARFVSERDVPVFERFAAELLTLEADAASPPRRELEVTVLSAQGAVQVRVSGALVEGASPVALLAVEDVTARRLAEQALQEALRRRDDFLGTLSHELRNPLAPIRNGLYLLDHSPPGGDVARRALLAIERQVGHLTRLVDDLLDVTRIARGKLQLRRRVQDLGEVLLRTVDDHRSGFEAAGVSLAAPLAPEPFWADVDPTRLAQVIGNLLSNALKFTARGDRVAVELRRDGPSLLLTVADTGAGIDHDVLSRLFEPFMQGPQTLARTAGGLGLGLATVRGLVELHGGSVSITSPGAGLGTTVTVSLPGAAPPASRPAGPAPVHAGRHRVLVIDDNQDAAASLKEILEMLGQEVVTAHDATGGLTAARGFHPEIVICDIGLPGLNGYDFARALRADEALRATYVVALSGYARPEDVRHSLQAGFDRHVAKPLHPDQLEALLADARSAPPAALVPGAAETGSR